MIQTKARGFTLIEILVAMAVLSLLMAMFIQISNVTSSATKVSRQQMDAAQEVRSVLDALSSDLENVVTQNGATLLVKNVKDASTGNINSSLAFVTRSRGPSGSTSFRLMATAYQLQNNQLIRSSSEIPWSNPDLFTPAANAVTSTNFTVLANNILRFEIVLELDNGQLIPVSQQGTWISSTGPDGQTAISNSFSALTLHKPISPSSNPTVRAIIVAVSALDPQTGRLSNATSLGTSFAAATSGQTPASVWRNALSSGSITGVPKPALSAVCIGQRIYAFSIP